MKQYNLTLKKYDSESVETIRDIDNIVVDISPIIVSNQKLNLVGLLDITQILILARKI